MFKIPVYQPSLLGNEKKYVNECIDSTWISSKGKFISEFENQFSRYINTSHATAVCNGTVALHLALVTLGVGPGDEVIVPTLTYIASVNAIAYVGATPVFVDSLKDTWQMDPSDVQLKISPRTKAILSVHLYGHPCDMESLCKIAKDNNLFLIEDCAEALGSMCGDKHVGGFGDISTFSFYGNKTITTGEGGMVVTNDYTLYERAVHFKGQGLSKHREYWHDVIGFNYRMTNICAAIGVAQLERADELIQKKREIALWYRRELHGLPLTFHEEIGNVKHSYWMISILLENHTQRDSFRNLLAQDGIETRPLFYPIHTMPMYSQHYHKHPVAEDIARRGINLPSYPDLTEEQVQFICEVIRKSLLNV